MLLHDSHDATTDEAIMLAWQSGDAAAFDRLYERHRGGVFRYFLRQCRDRGNRGKGLALAGMILGAAALFICMVGLIMAA